MRVRERRGQLLSLLFVFPSTFPLAFFSFLSLFSGRDVRSIRRAQRTKETFIFNFNDITQPVIRIDSAEGENNSLCNKASNGSLNHAPFSEYSPSDPVSRRTAAYHRLHIVKPIYIVESFAGHRGCTCTGAYTPVLYLVPLPGHFATFCNVWETNKPTDGRLAAYKLQISEPCRRVSLSAVSTPLASCCMHPVLRQGLRGG